MIILAFLSFIRASAITPDDQACQEQLMQVLLAPPSILNPNPDVYAKMNYYSGGFKLNNLGNYNKCNDLDEARYTVVGEGNFYYAFCVPKVCSREELSKILSGNFTQNTKVFGEKLSAGIAPSAFEFPKQYYDDNCESLDTSAALMVTFIVCVVAFSLFATLVELISIDYFSKYFTSSNQKEALIEEHTTGPQDHGKLMRCLLSFSLYSNVKKLFDSRSADRLGQKDPLDILNGIRVMSIGWVVLGHVTLMYFTTPVLSNYEDLPDIMKKFNKTIIYAGVYAVDTFFFLSGLLMSFLFLKGLDTPRGLRTKDWIMVYVHRYLRITPTLLFVLLFWWSMQPYFGSGPLWFTNPLIHADCPDYWYTNIIYLNNFIPDGKWSGCVEVGWYLANDMQFFIISPIILFVYHKKKIAGWSLIGALNVLSILSSGLIAYHFNLHVSLFAPQNTEDYGPYYYSKPYVRVAPYAIGLGVGMILYSCRVYKANGRVYDKFSVKIGELFDKEWFRYLSFIIGLGLVSLIVFIQYDNMSNPGPDGKYNSWGEHRNIAFMAFDRFVFTLGLTMIIMPSLLGYMKLLTSFLGASAWTPLARINFAIYLIHYNILFTVYINQHTELYFSEYYLIRDTIYFFFISAIAGFLVTMFIEFPCMNLERVLLRPAPRKVEKNEVTKDLKPIK